MGRHSADDGELSDIYDARDKALAEGTCMPPPIGCGQPVGKHPGPEYKMSGLCTDCQRRYHVGGDDWS